MGRCVDSPDGASCIGHFWEARRDCPCAKSWDGDMTVKWQNMMCHCTENVKVAIAGVNAARALEFLGSNSGGMDIETACEQHGSWRDGNSCECSERFAGDFCTFDCGAHGRGGGGATACTCDDGYTGERCEFAPSYNISGCSSSLYARDGSLFDPSHCGIFVRTPSHQCDGAPTYQLGGSDGPGLFRHRCAQDSTCAGKTRWVVASSTHLADCDEYPDYFASYYSPDADGPTGAGYYYHDEYVDDPFYRPGAHGITIDRGE